MDAVLGKVKGVVVVKAAEVLGKVKGRDEAADAVWGAVDEPSVPWAIVFARIAGRLSSIDKVNLASM